MPMTNEVEEFKNALLLLDRTAVRHILQETIGRLGLVPSLEWLVTTSLEDIGRSWEEGKIALSQVYMSARICEDLSDEFLPSGNRDHVDTPRMAVAVFEDYHLLGKRIVCSILRSAGHDPIDYGRVDIETVLQLVAHDRIRILFLSVLMLPSALHIAELRRRLDQAAIPVKIVVGGAPFRFDEKLWQEVGADAMGRTASDAIDIVNRVTGGMPCTP